MTCRTHRTRSYRCAGSWGGAPLNLQAEVQVTPGQNVHLRLPQADWQSLHAQGDLTLVQNLDRSTGQFKWSVANLADLNQLLGQHLAGSLTGALNLVPAAPGAVAGNSAQTSLQVNTAGLQIGGLKVEASLTGTGPLNALNLTLAAKAPVLGEPAQVAASGPTRHRQEQRDADGRRRRRARGYR